MSICPTCGAPIPLDPVDELRDQLRAAGHCVTLSSMTDVAGAASVLGVSLRTLQRWKRCGEGPLHHDRGGRVFYQIKDLVSWITPCDK